MESRRLPSRRRSRSWLPLLPGVAVAAAFAGGALLLRARMQAPNAHVQAGRADYLHWCAPCHGPDGRGDGPLAARLAALPPDLTAIAERSGGTFHADLLEGFLDGRDLIALHGGREMPEWGGVFEAAAGDDPAAADRARAGLDDRVAYLWSIQR